MCAHACVRHIMQNDVKDVFVVVCQQLPQYMCSVGMHTHSILFTVTACKCIFHPYQVTTDVEYQCKVDFIYVAWYADHHSCVTAHYPFPILAQGERHIP